MSIISLDKIKGIGVYPNFTWPRDLENFKAFNLIYGWNGSGKTTLSRLLRYLENNVLPEDWELEFKISTSGGAVENSNPDFLSGSICVFNVDFVEENIKWSEGRTKKLLIGKATQELSAKLSVDRLTLKNDREKNTEDNKSLEKANKDRDNFLQKRASEIKKRLTTNIQDQYRNYNSPRLKDTFSTLEKQDATSHTLDTQKETLLNAEIQQNAMPELSPVHLPQAINVSLLSEAKEILLKSPASSFIDALKKDSDLNAWVKKGYDIHMERNESTCQFCLQSLPHIRMEELEKHFSDEYKNFIAEIDRIGIAVKGCRDKYSAINLVHSADFYKEFQEEYKTPQEKFYAAKNQWQEQIDKVLSYLRQKRENPFGAIETEFLEEIAQFESEVLSDLSAVNALTEKHNTKAKNLNNHIAQAKQAIEHSIVTKLLDEYRKLEKNISSLEKQTEERGKKITILAKEVEETEAKAIQPKIGENQVNKDLHRFLGREDIKLQYEEDGYSITRGGKKARNLSESEKTAIALIYFFSKIREGNPIEEKIIVIDDPISSLDSQSTHFALGFIKDNIIAAKQVFLLTHNFYCLKEVKRWKTRKGFKKENFYIYMLECRTPSDKSHREAILGKLYPLLDKYD
jgi:wobble nucleotide-excising tRNase